MSRSLKRQRESVATKSKWQTVLKPGISWKGGQMGMLTSDRFRQRIPELKFVDIGANTLNITNASTPPTGQSLLQLAQGAAGYNRIGQRIRLHSLRITGLISPIASQAGQAHGRILIVYDKQPNAALCVWSDVILAVTQSGATSSTVKDGFNLANRDRFQVLMDHHMYLPGSQDSAGIFSSIAIFTANDLNPTMMNVDRYIKLHGKECHFNNTNGGTIADIQTGSLVLFFASDGTGSGNWHMDYNIRVRFMDE